MCKISDKKLFINVSLWFGARYAIRLALARRVNNEETFMNRVTYNYCIACDSLYYTIHNIQNKFSTPTN